MTDDVVYLDPDFWPARDIEATLERPADFNKVARWQAAAHAAVSLIPGEHAAARKVADIEDDHARRLTILSQRLGHLARTITYGDDPETPLLSIAACALAWLDHIAGENAR